MFGYKSRRDEQSHSHGLVQYQTHCCWSVCCLLLSIWYRAISDSFFLGSISKRHWKMDGPRNQDVTPKLQVFTLLFFEVPSFGDRSKWNCFWFFTKCSGRTEHIPHLLKYSCHIGCRFLPSNYFTPFSAIFSSKCFVSTVHNLLIYSTLLRVRAVSPAKVCGPFASNMDGESTDGYSGNEKRDLSISVMLSKPILALEFNCLQMKVEAPTIIPQEKHGWKSDPCRCCYFITCFRSFHMFILWFARWFVLSKYRWEINVS